MFSKLLRHLQNSLPVRLTIWYSSLFIFSTLGLFGTAYLSLSSSLKQRDQDAIESKLTEYAAEYEVGGMQTLKKALEVETGESGKPAFVVRVATSSGVTTFLHIPSIWSGFSATHLTSDGLSGNPWAYMAVRDRSDDDDEAVIEIASRRLSDRTLIQIGASTDDRDDLLERFRDIFVGVTIPLLLMGFASGSFLAYRALLPVRSLLSSLQAIITTGDFNAQVPIAKSDDELNKLGVLFNGLLNKINALVNGMQSSLDNVAHDLRTPMTRLRVIAEVALQAEKSEELSREALVNCVEESERIIAMVNTIMDISEAETGMMTLARNRVNVAELIDQVLALYGHVAEEKQIAVDATVPKELTIIVDRNRMLQVLANLLDNAIKYTGVGGEVNVVARSIPGEVVISVKDTGVGIPPEERSKIWDRLYRGDKSRSQRGIGLGLSLVKAIMHAHQGRAELYTEVGHGSTFVLHIPIDISARV
jgi:signal transduction histidine kinase